MTAVESALDRAVAEARGYLENRGPLDLPDLSTLEVTFDPILSWIDELGDALYASRPLAALLDYVPDIELTADEQATIDEIVAWMREFVDRVVGILASAVPEGRTGGRGHRFRTAVRAAVVEMIDYDHVVGAHEHARRELFWKQRESA